MKHPRVEVDQGYAVPRCSPSCSAWHHGSARSASTAGACRNWSQLAQGALHWGITHFRDSHVTACLPRLISWNFPAATQPHVAAAKAFYTDVFGWAFRDWAEDYVDTLSSGLSCGFNADPAHAPQQPLVVIPLGQPGSQPCPGDCRRWPHQQGRSSVFPAAVASTLWIRPGNELAIWSDLDQEQLQA